VKLKRPFPVSINDKHVGYKPFMSEEFRLLLQMKRTSKLILLLVGFVAASCILQLAIVVGKFDLDDLHQYVEGQRFASPELKPPTNPATTNGELNRRVKN
jgi:hypothetical protein